MYVYMYIWNLEISFKYVSLIKCIYTTRQLYILHY